MNCLVCNHKLNANVARCPVCGMAVIGDVQGDDRGIKQLATQFFKKKFAGVKLGIKTYTYALSDNDLDLEDTSDIVIADVENLTLGQLVWFPEPFAEVLENRKVTLDTYLKTADNRIQPQTVSINLKKTDKESYIGVILEDELRLRVLIGTKNNFAVSDQINLTIEN